MACVITRLPILLAIAVAGCGGAAEAGHTTQPAKPKRLLVATLGDSITAGTPAWDPDPGAREPLGTGADPRSQYQYWARRRNPKLRFRNCGVNRERTDQIALRLERCARGADVIVIQGGINDIAQGMTPDAAAATIEAMVKRAKAMGLRVGIAQLLPWNNGYPEADPAIRAVNRLIGQIARREGATVLPFYRTLEDPDAPGRMRPEWTDEGDHPSISGYRRLGELAFKLP